MILNIRDKNIFEFRSFSLRIITIFVFLLCVYSVKAQNLEHVAFDTNGAMGECLFPQDENGNIKFVGVVNCKMSPDTIMGLAKEFIYDLTKKYKAKTSNVLEGITKVACDMELKIGKNYISVSVWGANIGTWERAASTIKFNLVIDIRDGKYRYTLSDFYTDRRRIPGEAKDQGPSNMIHWQRVNSLTKEMEKAKAKSKSQYQEQIDFENAMYKAEYAAVQDVITGLKTFTVIKDDF